MRKLIPAFMALVVTALTFAAPARADDPYWRAHSDWQPRNTFHDKQYQQETWAHDHCVRDWNGGEFCRR